MSNSLKFFCVSILGVLTAVLVAAANAFATYLLGFSLFSFSYLVFIPVGAILVGIAATSGYYLGCLWLQLRPGILLFAQIVVVAALTNILIYYFEYLGAVTQDRPDLVTSIEGFIAYLGYSLGHQEMTFGGSAMNVGAIGEFGYVLAVVDFVGFLVGGFASIMFLLRAPACKDCSLFYRRVARKARHFANRHEAKRLYYDGLFALPPDGPDFAVRSALGARRGAFTVTTTLFECPGCKGQLWRDEAAELDDRRRWAKLDELKRSKVMPAGIDLAPMLRGRETPAREHTAEVAAPSGQT